MKKLRIGLSVCVLLMVAQTAHALDLKLDWTLNVLNHTGLIVVPCTSVTGPCSGQLASLPLTATTWTQTNVLDGLHCYRIDATRGSSVISSAIVSKTTNAMTGTITNLTATELP